MSASKRSESDGAGDGRRRSKKPSTSTGKSGGGAARGDLSRALRTAYDDTLREPVPDDFLDLIGKLS